MSSSQLARSAMAEKTCQLRPGPSRRPSDKPAVTIHIQPTTGGQIDFRVPGHSTVASLKRTLSSRLKVAKDRIVLLHKNKQLMDGTLESNSVEDGARLTLLPSIETGILALRPEQSVMQALEGLSDAQVDNFLTGKAPLNLTIRLGDHVMFIQLQLSTVSPCSSSQVTSGNQSVVQQTTTAARIEESLSLPTPPTTPTSPSGQQAFILPPKLPTFPLVTPSTPPHSPNVGGDSIRHLPTSLDNNSYLDSRALAEASRNLTHTLRQLSSAALGKKVDDVQADGVPAQSGAVIESMYHHGKGVYSGTFSGTLSPALQDQDGRPRRDISTIIHILNDLLGASSNHPCCWRSEKSVSSIPQTTTSLSQEHTEVSKRQSENSILRGKLEHIHSMLEERRRRRRRAKRVERSAPYSVSLHTAHEVGSSNAMDHEGFSAAIDESLDKSANPNLKSETVVV